MTNPQPKTDDAPLFENDASSPEIKPKGRGLAPARNAPPIADRPPPQTGGLIDLIREVVSNPAVDIEKMKAILDMQERVLDRTAKAEFDAALADMQPNLPVINQRGRIEIRAKDAKGERTGAVQQSTKFAKWEDINDGIKPILGDHGFALSFRTGLSEDGRVEVIGILSHRAGHREQSKMVLPHDSTGSKNSVQAIGSSTSYGKRYVACALLNITSRGEDDNGAHGGGDPIDDDAPKIAKEQLDKLIKAVAVCGVGVPKFCQHYRIDKVADLPAALFDEAIKSCADFAARQKGGQKNG